MVSLPRGTPAIHYNLSPKPPAWDYGPGCPVLFPRPAGGSVEEVAPTTGRDDMADGLQRPRAPPAAGALAEWATGPRIGVTRFEAGLCYNTFRGEPSAGSGFWPLASGPKAGVVTSECRWAGASGPCCSALAGPAAGRGESGSDPSERAPWRPRRAVGEVRGDHGATEAEPVGARAEDPVDGGASLTSPVKRLP